VTSPPRRRGVALVLTLAFLAMVPARISRAEGSDPAGEGPGTALLVFLTYRSARPLALDPIRMRLSGMETIGAALEGRGQRVVPQDDVEPLMREWRVRSGRRLQPEFLDALEGSAERLLVVELVVYPDRLIALARGLEPKSGTLIFAEAVEEPCGDLWGDPLEASIAWKDVIERTARSLVEREAQGFSAPAETLIVLPVTPVGAGSGQGDVATHCLLGSILESGRWVVPDPFLVELVLRREGHDLLDAEARLLLASRYAPRAILEARLVSFGFAMAAGGPAQEDEEADARRMIAFELGTGDAIYLTLLVIDGESGRIVAGSGEYLEPEDPQGLFGILKEIRVAGRLKNGTDRLVRSIARAGEDG